jgi:hypothetical protein
MAQDHSRELARLVREAAKALQNVENYRRRSNLPAKFFTAGMDYPFSQSLDEQCLALFSWVRAIDPDYHAAHWPWPHHYETECSEGCVSS